MNQYEDLPPLLDAAETPRADGTARLDLLLRDARRITHMLAYLPRPGGQWGIKAIGDRLLCEREVGRLEPWHTKVVGNFVSTQQVREVILLAAAERVRSYLPEMVKATAWTPAGNVAFPGDMELKLGAALAALRGEVLRGRRRGKGSNT